VVAILDQWSLMMAKINANIENVFCFPMFQYHRINVILTIDSLDPVTSKHSLL